MLVTSYNSREFVDRFVDWMGACHKYFDEIIIVDDCSTDGSCMELLGKLSDLDNIEHISLSKNSGRPSVPRNVGIKHFRGVSRVVFLDIDDLLTTDYLSYLNKEEIMVSKNVYSGTKFELRDEVFPRDYLSDFTRVMVVTPKILHFKNFITLSGSSVPLSIIEDLEFRNQPLEDWLFWRALVSKNEGISLIKLLDVPVGYDVGPSLSPSKAKQIKRVSSNLHFLEIPCFFLLTLKLRFVEMCLRFRVKKFLRTT